MDLKINTIQSTPDCVCCVLQFLWQPGHTSSLISTDWLWVLPYVCISSELFWFLMANELNYQFYLRLPALILFFKMSIINAQSIERSSFSINYSILSYCSIPFCWTKILRDWLSLGLILLHDRKLKWGIGTGSNENLFLVSNLQIF